MLHWMVPFPVAYHTLLLVYVLDVRASLQLVPGFELTEFKLAV